MKTREEHIAWCKRRALDELDFNGPSQGCISMMSDLKKHPETENHGGIQLTVQFMLMGLLKTKEEVKKHIEGFN